MIRQDCYESYFAQDNSRFATRFTRALHGYFLPCAPSYHSNVTAAEVNARISSDENIHEYDCCQFLAT